MSTAHPLEHLPPRLDGRVLAVSRWLMPLWLRWRSRIDPVEVHDPERLVEAMRAFQAGESRLMLAFRHPSLDDPACMAHLLWAKLGQAGRRQGVRFDPAPTGQFLFDRGIPLWAGPAMGWLFTRLGGGSIQRGKLDLPALRIARQLLLDGPHPFGLAPEGVTNGHNELLSPLEPGAAQLALWTATDLATAERPERMELLPIGLQYFFVGSAWRPIEALLSQLEEGAGIPPDPSHGLAAADLYGRLQRLGERMLSLIETFYRDTYPLSRTGASASPENPGASAVGFAQRLHPLLDGALLELERSFGLEPNGTLTDRCRRLEQAGWERTYPDGVAEGPSCPLERGLAKRLAEETEARMWHMRVVESFVAVSGTYVKERPSQERFADTLLLLWDTQCRIRGDIAHQRPRLGRRRALISIGEPIVVDGWLEGYRHSRRQAVADLTGELRSRLESLVVPSPLA